MFSKNLKQSFNSKRVPKQEFGNPEKDKPSSIYTLGRNPGAIIIIKYALRPLRLCVFFLSCVTGFHPAIFGPMRDKLYYKNFIIPVKSVC